MLVVRRSFIFALLILLTASTDTFGVEFAPGSAYAVGSSPQSVLIADFNGDGKPDIAVLNINSGDVSVLLGNGDGTFQAAKNYTTASNGSSIAVGDFNGDGKMDLAVLLTGIADNAVSGEVLLLLGNGDGSFQTPVATTLTPFAHNFAVGDFNGDKKADLVVANVDPTSKAITLEILLGKGDGTFQAAQSVPASGLASSTFAIADFNKDQKLDLAVNASGGILVLEGNGDGTFTAGNSITPLAIGTLSSVLTADVNGDGNVDLIADSRFTSCSGTIIHFCRTTQKIGVLLGAGDGTFAVEQVFASAASGLFTANNLISPIVIGEFNGDGKLDVVYRQRSGATYALVVKLGKGDGTFSTSIIMPDPGTLAGAQDLNGDNLSDVVEVDALNGNVDVLLNDSPGAGSDLGIISSSASPEPVGVGTNLAYSADVMNEGPQDATGVTFTDTLPSSVTFVSATASQGTCAQAKLVVTCTIGALADTADVTVTIVVTPGTVGSITNTMKVAGDQTDGATTNNSASQISTVVPVYALSVTKSGNGTGTVSSDSGLNGPISCGTTCSATFLTGAVVNVNAIPDSGSLLMSWGGACSATPSTQGCSVTMDSDKLVSAAFVLGITLNVSITGGGTGSVNSSDGSIVCSDTGGTCSSLNLPGTVISLTAAPSNGSQFSGWSGACSGSNPNACSVTLNSNQTVTANIVPAPDFSVDPTTTSLTLTRGGQASETLTFPAQGGFAGTIGLLCSVSGSVPTPTCGISPNSVSPGKSATLTVNAGNLSASLAPRTGGILATLLPLALFACVLTYCGEKKGRGLWALGVLILAVTIFPAACGSGGGPPPPQNYTVTVTASSGPIQHSIQIAVTVQ